MRAELQAVLARKRASVITDPAERVAALRRAVEEAEEAGNMTEFTVALAAYERACLENPGAEP